ncbi:MAG: LamG domain-containing protein [Bacteroidales bacterium]
MKKSNKTIKAILLLLCLLVLISIPAQEINLEDELLLFLPMDGDALDYSGNSVPTLVEGPLLAEDRFGNPESAYQFDGLDDSINLNNNLPLITSKSFTICVWAKILGESSADIGGNTFFEQRDDIASLVASSTIIFTGYFQDRLVLFLRSNLYGDYYKSLGVADVDPRWHHYVAVMDEERHMKVFMDTKLISESAFGNDGDFVSSIDHVNLGAHHYEHKLHSVLNGIMDEVYIYNRALNMCEINALYTGELLEER